MSLQLPPHLALIASEKLGETSDEVRSTALETLRQKILELPEISDRVQDVSDKNLIRFLRSRKFDIEKALNQTIEYQHFYTKYAQELKDIKKEEFNQYLQLEKFLTVIKKDTIDGHVVIIMHPKSAISLFTKEFVRENPNLMLRFNIYLFEKLSFDPQVQVCGLVVINTFAKLTMWDQMAMSGMAPMSHQTDTFKFFQILGFRFGGAYIFEQPFIFNIIWALARPFMSEKIRNRFNLCGSDYSRLTAVVNDVTQLPIFVGGTVENYESTWIQEQEE